VKPTGAALGFKLHTGWAAVVAVANAPGNIRILLRRRLELLPAGKTLPRFAYHAAAELPERDAFELLERVTAACRVTTQAALQQLLTELHSQHISVAAAGIPTGSTKLPESLASILRSHTLIHTAEGRLFQQAVVAACEGQGLNVICPTERAMWSTLGSDVREKLDGLRKTVGSPWGADQKTATAAALMALR